MTKIIRFPQQAKIVDPCPDKIANICLRASLLAHGRTEPNQKDLAIAFYARMIAAKEGLQ